MLELGVWRKGREKRERELEKGLEILEEIDVYT
jgi:hypothetical protein